MGDSTMSNIIMSICKDTPEIGELACFLHDKIEDYAKKSPNILLSYKDIFFITEKYCAETQVSQENSIYAVHVLCNPSVDFLKLKYYFIDDFNDPVEIRINDVVEANASHSLEHPYTGELIYDYKNYVFPFFTIEHGFKEGL